MAPGNVCRHGMLVSATSGFERNVLGRVSLSAFQCSLPSSSFVLPFGPESG